MADIKILDLEEATEITETTDYIPVVDTSDTAQDSTGTTKKATVRKLLGDKALPSGDFVGTTDTQTLTGKTISTTDNTFSGMLDWFYPVGTIYETTSSNLDTVDKVNAHFGGTWEFYGAGRVLVAKSTDTEFDTIGETGGEKTHTLTIAEMPLHNHTVTFNMYTATGVFGYTSPPPLIDANDTLDKNIQSITSSTGGGGAHNNLPPYQVVYRYRRTA